MLLNVNVVKFSVVMVIDSINKAVSAEDVETLMILLKSSCLKLPSQIHMEEKYLYMRMLKKVLLHKECQNLWFDDIVDIINEVNAESFNVKELTDSLVQLNSVTLKNNVDEFWNALSNPVLSTTGIIDTSCKDIYFQMFSKALKKKGQHICPWIVCHTDAGNTVYIDVESYTYSWATPKNFVPYSRYLTRKEVSTIIDKTNKHHVSKYKQSVIATSITKFQAYCRGYLLRKVMTNRLKYFMANEEFVIKIQSWWRRILVERKYRTLIKMKAIETKLIRERKKNPWAWYKVQVCNIFFYIYTK